MAFSGGCNVAQYLGCLCGSILPRPVCHRSSAKFWCGMGRVRVVSLGDEPLTAPATHGCHCLHWTPKSPRCLCIVRFWVLSQSLCASLPDLSCSALLWYCLFHVLTMAPTAPLRLHTKTLICVYVPSLRGPWQLWYRVECSQGVCPVWIGEYSSEVAAHSARLSPLWRLASQHTCTPHE